MCALIFMSSHFPSVIRSCFAYERERTPESFPHHKSLIWSLSVTQFKNWLVSTFNLLLSAFHSETFVRFNEKVLNTLTLPADDSHPCDLCHFLGLSLSSHLYWVPSSDSPEMSRPQEGRWEIIMVVLSKYLDGEAFVWCVTSSRLDCLRFTQRVNIRLAN